MIDFNLLNFLIQFCTKAQFSLILVFFLLTNYVLIICLCYFKLFELVKCVMLPYIYIQALPLYLYTYSYHVYDMVVILG